MAFNTPTAVATCPGTGTTDRVGTRKSRRQWETSEKVLAYIKSLKPEPSVRGFAMKHGFSPRNFHGYLKENRAWPSDVLWRLAKVSGLPMEYWANPDLPFPPPSDYLNDAEGVIEEIVSQFRTYRLADAQRVLRLVSDQARLMRLLDAERAFGHDARG